MSIDRIEAQGKQGIMWTYGLNHSNCYSSGGLCFSHIIGPIRLKMYFTETVEDTSLPGFKKRKKGHIYHTPTIHWEVVVSRLDEV